MSRVLLAGVAVAGAAVTTSAFTASNTVDSSVAGYGEATVTGAETSDIEYILDGSNKSLVDAINFELVENLDNVVDVKAYLTLKDGGVVVGSPILCTISPFTTVTPVACAIPDQPLESFDSIGLTVSE